MTLELTDMPKLAAEVMTLPWSEGCEEAQVLDELRIEFLAQGAEGVSRAIGVELEMLEKIVAGEMTFLDFYREWEKTAPPVVE